MRPVNPFYAARISSRGKIPRTESLSYNVLDLFSGIGGFSLGLERAGMKTVALCEIDSFCHQVLSRHWPTVPIYSDVKQLNARRLHHDQISNIDIVTGGYPCQPFSIAGNQRGTEDPRHLWPEMYRLIREIRPRWVVCENVLGHVELGLDAVLADLENAGYAATTFVVPACAVGAPHRRDRIWIVAHAAGVRLPRSLEQTKEQSPQWRQFTAQLSPAPFWGDFPESFTVGNDDGISYRVDRTRSLGNAVVPQIPELIGRTIIAFDRSSAPAINCSGGGRPLDSLSQI